MNNFIIKNILSVDDLAQIIQSVYEEDNQYLNINDISNNYGYYLEKFKSDDYLRLANKLLVRFTDDSRIKYHPKLTEFAITYGYDKNLLKKWLNSEIDVPGIESIFKMLFRTGIFIPIVNNVKISQLFIEFVYNLNERQKYNTLIYIDGDNLQTMTIPIYKEIINASNIKILGFYVYKIIPHFIDLYTRINSQEYNKSIRIISSMNDKKDAADVALNTAHSVILDRNMQDQIASSNYVVTNDEYAVEIIEESIEISQNQIGNESTFERINTVSFKPQRKEYLYKDVWYPFNYDFVRLPYGNLVPGLNITDYSYSPWFITLIKSNLTIKPVARYERIFQYIRESNNFEELYRKIDSVFNDDNYKLIYWSQYLVIISMKYFSFDELIGYFRDHVTYIEGKNVLEGNALNEFMSIEFNDILKYFYRVTNLEEMLITNEDLKIIFNIKEIYTFVNKISRISFK